MDMKKLQQLVDAKLTSLSEHDYIDLWNAYCDMTSGKSKIFYMEDANEKFDWLKTESPEDIIRKVQSDFGNFDADDAYFVFDDCGDPQSFSTYIGNYIDRDELVEAIVSEKLIVHSDILDLAALKEQCSDKHLRPFTSVDEFTDKVCALGMIIKISHKDRDDVREGLIVELRNDGNPSVTIGTTQYTFDHLFEEWNYYDYANGKWVPFGMEV